MEKLVHRLFLTYRQTIKWERKFITEDRTGDTNDKGMRGSSRGSESESNKWRGGISGVGEFDVNLCRGNVIIITKQSSSYFKML